MFSEEHISQNPQTQAHTYSGSFEWLKILRLIHEHLLQSMKIGRKAPASPSRPHTPASHITLESLTLSSELTEKMVSNIRSISRLQLVIILLHHSKGLTYDSLMTLSREFGKPMIYSWLNTHFQRKERGSLSSQNQSQSLKRSSTLSLSLARRSGENHQRNQQ